SESGNNSVAGSNLVPLFSFCIPGDAEAALILGVLMIHGLVPGPQLFESDCPLVYGIFVSLIIADIILIFIGLTIVRYFAMPITKIQTKYLYPVILILMFAGTFGVTRSMFGLSLLLVFGIIGLLMKLNNFSIPAFIIGFILGAPLEGWLQRTVVLVKSHQMDVFLKPSFIITFCILILLGFIMSRANSSPGKDK